MSRAQEKRWCDHICLDPVIKTPLVSASPVSNFLHKYALPFRYAIFTRCRCQLKSLLLRLCLSDFFQDHSTYIFGVRYPNRLFVGGLPREVS